jgi:hypothetical protein
MVRKMRERRHAPASGRSPSGHPLPGAGERSRGAP